MKSEGMTADEWLEGIDDRLSKMVHDVHYRTRLGNLEAQESYQKAADALRLAALWAADGHRLMRLFAEVDAPSMDQHDGRRSDVG